MKKISRLEGTENYDISTYALTVRCSASELSSHIALVRFTSVAPTEGDLLRFFIYRFPLLLHISLPDRGEPHLGLSRE